VGPGISCGARKLARTPRVTKKKKELKNEKVIHNFIFLVFKSIMVHLNFVFFMGKYFQDFGMQFISFSLRSNGNWSIFSLVKKG
jgi:hypothetical protein